MNTLQTQKENFKNWFDNTIRQQFAIRQELIGESITDVYYIPKAEGWGIDIKDETAIHLPYGNLTFQTTSGNTYRINTSYQTWCGGIFGIMLEKINTKGEPDPSVSLENQLLLDEKWDSVKTAKINAIQWYWKRDKIYKPDKQKFTVDKVREYLFEDSFTPESLVFLFDNGKKIFFFALEPDEEFPKKNTYNLLGGGEEIMIFFDEGKLDRWNITSLGFEIQA